MILDVQYILVHTLVRLLWRLKLGKASKKQQKKKEAFFHQTLIFQPTILEYDWNQGYWPLHRNILIHPTSLSLQCKSKWILVSTWEMVLTKNKKKYITLSNILTKFSESLIFMSCLDMSQNFKYPKVLKIMFISFNKRKNAKKVNILDSYQNIWLWYRNIKINISNIVFIRISINW